MKTMRKEYFNATPNQLAGYLRKVKDFPNDAAEAIYDEMCAGYGGAGIETTDNHITAIWSANLDDPAYYREWERHYHVIIRVDQLRDVLEVR